MNDFRFVNGIPAFFGDLLVVTEYGWRSAFLEVGTATPRRVA